MHVIIVGAGEVGWYLAQRLGAEGNDVVVVEQNEVIAAAIGAELDVQVVVGSATVPSTLRAAGIERADLLAGVTQNDEVNLLASLLAKVVLPVHALGSLPSFQSSWYGMDGVVKPQWSIPVTM